MKPLMANLSRDKNDAMRDSTFLSLEGNSVSRFDD
jgi:hypothetical protein